MLFNSYEFIFAFLPITFFVYFYLNHNRLTEAGKGFLVFSSLFFYSWWNIAYLPIILASMGFNYIAGNSLNNKEERRILSKKSTLTLGIVSNIALLGYFKYTDFMIDNLNYWIFAEDIPSAKPTLPLAISFFTFQQISYLIDSYRQETKKYNFLNYSLFVTFFPQLIAGPIVHHKEMMPQFVKTRNKIKNYRNIAMGLSAFSIGLFKKVVIADAFAIWATTGFNKANSLSSLEAWATSLSYTFQLYFDFSGYTDMAVGLSLLFNIKLPFNFNSPYKATDIQDFWRRWHITLSRFLKNYVYIPLGGNRRGEARIYSNLLATFIIGGIWHGADWTFVFWGFLHGLALTVHRAWSKLGFKLWTWLAWLITFNFVNIAWIFFRSKDWDDALNIIARMLSFNYFAISKQFANVINYMNPLSEYYKLNGSEIQSFVDVYTFEALILGLILVLFFENSNEHLNYKKINLANSVTIAIIFSFSMYIVLTVEISEFLYFNF